MKEKLHFHSFDAFRFFAFLKVFLLHAPLVVVASSPAWMTWWNQHIRFGGGIGVSFFFVLSGFLITYILTTDILNQGNINPKRFFIRRAFRIVPLFYLMVLMAFLTPDSVATSIGFHMIWGGYDPHCWFSFTFTENIAMILNDNVPKNTPLSVFWSLCIEEQFYIYWMIAFFVMKKNWIPYFLIFNVFLAIGFRVYGDEIFATQHVNKVDLFSNLDYFSISGILGYFVASQYEKVANFVMKIPLFVKWGYIVFVLGMLFFQYMIFETPSWFVDVFWYTISAIVFTGLLLLFVPKNSQIKFSDNHIFTKLGKISYGLYVYHIVWIHIIYKFYIDYGIEVDGVRSYFVFIVTTFAMTVVTSYLSYRFFEKPILGLREKFFSDKKRISNKS